MYIEYFVPCSDKVHDCTNTEKVTDLFKFAVVVKFLLNLLIQVANQCFTSILDKSVLIGQFSFTLPL